MCCLCPIPRFDNTGKPVFFCVQYWAILVISQYWKFNMSQYCPVFSSIVEKNNTGIQYCIPQYRYWNSSIVYQLTILVFQYCVLTILVFQYCFLEDSGKPVLLVHHTGYPALYKVQSLPNSMKQFSKSQYYESTILYYQYCVSFSNTSYPVLFAQQYWKTSIVHSQYWNSSICSLDFWKYYVSTILVSSIVI